MFVHKGINLKYISTGSGNGSELNKGLAIAWTNEDPVHWSKFVTRPQSFRGTQVNECSCAVVLITID